MKLENHGEHLLALHELETLMEFASDPESGPWMKVMAQAIEDYELIHFPIGRPDKFLCPHCGAHEEPALNKAGDDVACAKCGKAFK